MKSKITYVVLTTFLCVFAINSTAAQQKQTTKKETQQMPILEQAKVASTHIKVDKPLDIQEDVYTMENMPTYVAPKATAYVAPKEDKKKQLAELKKLEAQKRQSIIARNERDKLTALVKQRLALLGKQKLLKKEKKSNHKTTSEERASWLKANAIPITKEEIELKKAAQNINN